MAGFVTNIITDSLSGLLSGAVATVGGVAGDAIAGIGDFVESSGQSVGNGISNKFDSWGQGVASYGGGANKASQTTKQTAQKAIKPAQGGVNGAKKSVVSASSKQKALPAFTKKPLNNSTNTVTSLKTNKVPVKTSNLSRTGGAIAKPKVTTSLKASPLKANATTSGKVIPQKQSLPATKRAAAVKAPIASKQDYKGPIALSNAAKSSPKPANKAVKGYVPNAGFVPTSNSEKHMAGTATGKYGGPINLGSLA